MRNQREQIAKILEENPHLRQRKNRYILIERMTGIEAETCKLICSIADEYRHQTKRDEVGEKMAEDWKSPVVAKFNQDSFQTWNQMFRKI